MQHIAALRSSLPTDGETWSVFRDLLQGTGLVVTPLMFFLLTGLHG